MKWYFPDEFKFYNLILMLLLNSAMDLIKLNCLICLSQTFGFNLLQETKYEGMNIEELFFHLKIAIINMGTKETVLAITDLDWDSFVLNHLESEKLDFSLSETCFFWKTIF